MTAEPSHQVTTTLYRSSRKRKASPLSSNSTTESDSLTFGEEPPATSNLNEAHNGRHCHPAPPIRSLLTSALGPMLDRAGGRFDIRLSGHRRILALHLRFRRCTQITGYGTSHRLSGRRPQMRSDRTARECSDRIVPELRLGLGISDSMRLGQGRRMPAPMRRRVRAHIAIADPFLLISRLSWRDQVQVQRGSAQEGQTIWAARMHDDGNDSFLRMFGRTGSIRTS